MKATFTAAALGRPGSREQLFAERFEAVFAFLRMALPDPAAAEEMAVESLITAVERHAECPADPAHIDPWLRGVALEQLATAARRRPQTVDAATPTRADRQRLERVLAGVSDTNLAALVRVLDPVTRQVVVLGLMAGIDAVTVGGIVGIPAAEVPVRATSGLGEIAGLLARYDRETEEIGIRARENAYHLRPRPGPMSNGMIVVKGDRAMVEHGPTSGFWYMAMRALARVFEKFYRHHEESAFDEDVGEPRQVPKPLKRTATDNPFHKPQRTPSMTDYRTPRSTPGMPSYRSPKSTPSTARLTSPHRTARAAAPAFGAMRSKKF